MKKIIQKYNKFVRSSFFGFGGLVLILQSMFLPNNLSFLTNTGRIVGNLAMSDIVLQEPKIEQAIPKRIVYVTVTAYSSTPDQTDDTPFITANGTRVRDGIIAANFLAFGTTVKFPDYFSDKEFVVTDRMHQRFSDRADIWFPTREEALDFGIRILRMEIF